ncbi:hypothetical protein SAMN04488498_101695 [Mesorhizobium albiziae]|uniref:Uncharacterized protein n=1 Tax=Neomesorhizobium albiziae TaxID=335020 RepID=A0A1I3VRU9_9HYPH|nr:hypothetical protein GCM10007937_08560 [Mesorhizobium albiziae]SFJ98134.1 hypothetical protein SAMN04488498_101695 [Mesorhizobium albiziae]
MFLTNVDLVAAFSQPAMEPISDLTFELLYQQSILLNLGARFPGGLEPGVTRTCSKVVFAKFAESLVLKDESANKRSVFRKAFYHFVQVKTFRHGLRKFSNGSP